MNLTEIMQTISYLLLAIGVMAFFVSVITQVIKSWPGLDKLPTAAVVIVLSLVLCPLSFVALMAWLKQPIVWDMMHGKVIRFISIFRFIYVKTQLAAMVSFMIHRIPLIWI